MFSGESEFASFYGTNIGFAKSAVVEFTFDFGRNRFFRQSLQPDWNATGTGGVRESHFET